MKILGKFWKGNDFIGFLVEKKDGSLIFGYDADELEPSYHVFSFKTRAEFLEFWNDNYRGR
jgi:hypothetical protein